MLLLLFGLTGLLRGQGECVIDTVDGLVISEVTGSGEIEVYNGSDATVDLSRYYLYTSPAYRQFEDLNLLCNDVVLAPGEVLTVSALPGFSLPSGEVGIYRNDDFTDPTALVAYLAYGAGEQKRENIAVAAGLIGPGAFAASPTATDALRAEATLTGLTYELGPASLCEPTASLAGVVAVPDGGTITTAGGAADTIVTAGDAFVAVTHLTTATSLSYWYIITDEDGTILGFANSANTTTLNLSGAPAGVCRIWGWSYRGLDDPMVGENIATLTDDFCEAISTDFVTVNRVSGCDILTNDITFADGQNAPVSICVDGTADNLDVIRNGGSGNNDATGWIITDAVTGEILGLPAGPPFNLDGAGAGVCEIWYVRYLTAGFSGNVVGNQLSDLAGCFDLSNPLRVIREVPDGGTLSLADGGTNFIGCAGDISFDVQHATAAPNLSYWYVITDDANTILGFANSANTSSLDLSGATAGTCRVWGWSYRGLPDPVMGQPLSSLDPEGACADLSDNFITVYREVPDGGTITTAGGAADTTVTAGDAFVSVTHTTTGGFLSYWYIITDEDGTILGFANSANTSTLDLSGAPAGVCRIWGWNYRGLDDPIVGEHIATLTDDFCEAVSADFITVNRVAEDGPGLDNVIINEVGADGRIELFNGTGAAVDVSSYWLCNFPAYTRLTNLTVECGSLTIEPGDYLVVSGFSGFDATDAELGLYTNNSFGSSASLISYLEWGSSGHQRAGLAVGTGIWPADFFLTPPTAGESIQTFPKTETDGLRWEIAAETFCATNSGTTSNGFLGEEVDLNLFPNPTAEILNVAVSGLGLEAGATLEVFDAAGRRVLYQEEAFGNGQLTLATGSLAPGSYLLRLTSEGRFTARRFTVR